MNMLVFDGHNDTLLNLAVPPPEGKRSFHVRSQKGHIDLPRAHEGGFAGGMFAVFVPPGPPARFMEAPEPTRTRTGYALPLMKAIDPGYAFDFASTLVANLYSLESASDGGFKVARNTADLRNGMQNGTVAAVLHFEGAEPIDPSLNNLQAFYDGGLRSLGIVWSRPNAFGEGVPFAWPHSPDIGPGLTPRGKELVRACNRLGILVDLSHLNEKGFRDVAKLTTVPLVVTHSAVHAICPTARNLTDSQIDAVGESNGVIGINFHVGDLREGGWQDSSVPMSEIARHIEYVAERIGIDHVALGSDFDEVSLTKLAHANWLRVLGECWKE